jgi:phage tail-like protein
MTVRKTGSQGDYFPMQNFKLEIDGVIQAGFKEISGIESETEIIEIKDGDDMTIHKRPGRTKYSNIILKRGFINDPALLEWYKKVVKGVTERKSGSVIVLDRAGQEAMRYNFFEAWPCKWKGPALDTKGDTHMVEELELACERIEKA